MADCLFCGIAQGKVPATIVHQDDEIVAFHDVRPVSPFHVLVIPREHVPSLAEADERLAGKIALAAAKVAADAGYGERGYRVVANVRADGGQTVAHLHFHVLAGRRHTWPPG